MTMYRPQKLWSTAIRLGTTTYNYYNPQSLGTGKAPPVIITLAMQHVHCVCSKYTCCCCLAFSMCSSTTTTYLLCFVPWTCNNASMCVSSICVCEQRCMSFPPQCLDRSMCLATLHFINILEGPWVGGVPWVQE